MEKFYELIKGEKPVFVEFFASWCPHCQRMMPVMEELKNKVQRKMTVLQYDIDNPEYRRLAEYYRVQSVPTMMMFKAGEQLWRQSGEIKQEDLFGKVRRIV